MIRTRKQFIEKNFRQESLRKIELANSIIDGYTRQGFSLTLRQLYYQLVARDLIPNRQTEYDKLSALLSDARRAGLIDWDAIEDRTRYLRGFRHYGSPGEAVEAAAHGYGIDLWDGQEKYLEAWVEKDALIDILRTACQPYDVPYFSCRGYTSDSELYKAGRRMQWYVEHGRKPVILHLGDHDPSGIDMSRDILQRLELFGEIPGMVDFHRIALNMDQVEQYNPPPNPAKETDSRHDGYVEKYGTSSWELDALEPQVLVELIQENIRAHLDGLRFQDRQRQEREEKQMLLNVAERWDRIAAMFA